MAISPLPPAPSTSDPANFASKGDALLSALPTFVTEANALQTDVNAKQVTASAAAVDSVNAKNAAESFANATKWVSGTTYGEGDVVWSPTNFKPYRRKTAGAGTTDPSLDATNWSAVAYFDSEGADVASATTTDIWATDGNTRHVTGNVTITSFGTAPQAGARMKLIFDGAPQLTQSANLNLNAGGSNITIEAGDWAEVYADTTTQFDVVVHRKSGTAIVAPSAASETVSGVVELATIAEVQAGTDTVRAVTPAGLLAATLGMGQSWQDVTVSRASGVNYTNTSGRAICVSVFGVFAYPNAISVLVNSVQVGYKVESYVNALTNNVQFIVPNGGTYSATIPGYSKWLEFR